MIAKIAETNPNILNMIEKNVTDPVANKNTIPNNADKTIGIEKNQSNQIPFANHVDASIPENRVVARVRILKN
jgi:hypothetical protein